MMFGAPVFIPQDNSIADLTDTVGGAGRRDSCVRRVDDYRRTYETVGRIEKPDFSPGFRVCGFPSPHANAYM